MLDPDKLLVAEVLQGSVAVVLGYKAGSCHVVYDKGFSALTSFVIGMNRAVARRLERLSSSFDTDCRYATTKRDVENAFSRYWSAAAGLDPGHRDEIGAVVMMDVCVQKRGHAYAYLRKLR